VEPPDKQWWLDPHTLGYSQPGAISEREAEGRLMRAFITERWVRVERPACHTFAGVLAGLARANPLSPADLAAADPAPVRIEPTGRDQDDMLVALGWLHALGGSLVSGQWPVASGEGHHSPLTTHHSPHGEELLRLRGRTPALSWRAIGRAVGKSHETARALYARALRLVADQANGRATAGGRAVAASLEAVREANRQAKLGAGR
jgi:hypothetical protein